jgi:hypothetical protein
MVWVRFFVASLLLAACSGTSTPATTPTFVPTTASTTTTTIEVTTTLDRLAEIEAIYQDLEERRLDALYTGDREAFAELYANEGYMEASLDLFDVVEFLDGWPPVDVVIAEVIHDSEGCIAARISTDYTEIAVNGEIADSIQVLERMESGDSGWGISYVGKGWTCEGPHPFEA